MNGTAATVADHHEHRDYGAAKIGMWLFLSTELLLFGGMFLLYAIYRAEYSEMFHYQALELDVTLGCINTLVLLTSSMTAAMSLTAVQRGQRKVAVWLIVFTIACAIAFLVIKYFEWNHKFDFGIFPGGTEAMLDPEHQKGLSWEKMHKGEQSFVTLYFMMTGTHGLHVIIGGILLAVVACKIGKKPFHESHLSFDEVAHLQGSKFGASAEKGAWQGEDIDANVQEVVVRTTYDPKSKKGMADRRYVTLTENAALYWHIVDAIWIFLFPLFYLIS